MLCYTYKCEIEQLYNSLSHSTSAIKYTAAQRD